jgi:nucleoid DNA-binding protein
MKLTKKKIAGILQTQIGLNETTSKEVIDLIFSAMEKTLKNGGSVVINKIGTLEPIELEARTHKGFNKVFSVPSMRKLKFTQSKVFEVCEVGELKTTSKSSKNLTLKKSAQTDEVDPEVEEMRKIFSRLL